MLKVLDHSMCTGDALEPNWAVIIGMLVKQDENCYYISSWVNQNQVNSEDTECFAILKKVVVKKQRLT